MHQCLKTPESNERCLCVAFEGAGDSWSYSLALRHAATAVRLYRPVHATRCAAWPHSPPWQELHVHDSPTDGRVLLLVGRAATSHWSMAVSVDNAQSAIVFDVACRLRSPPEFLGTTYAVSLPATQLQRAVEIEADAQGRVVRLDALAIDDQPPAIIALQGDRIIIRPHELPLPPVTVRWKYRVRLLASN